MRSNQTSIAFAIAVLILAGWGSCSSPSCLAQPRTRAEFSAAANQVKAGISEAEVRRLLGPPDSTSSDDFGTTSTKPNVEAIWFYGVDADSGFPTWGRVYFSQEPELPGRPTHREVSLVCGGAGKPLNSFDERELRKLLGLVAGISPMDGRKFDPQRLIVATNSLLPLGKENILLVIDEFARVSPPSHLETIEKVILLLRVLADVPASPGFLPLPEIGVFGPPPPSDLRQAPRFPLLIVEGVPLLIANGYATGGSPPTLEEEIKWFRQDAKLRSKPLKPLGDPLRLPDRVQELPIWKIFRADADEEQEILRRQVWRLLAHSRDLELRETETEKIQKDWWADVQNQVTTIRAGKSLQWDTKHSCYRIEPQ